LKIFCSDTMCTSYRKNAENWNDNTQTMCTSSVRGVCTANQRKSAKSAGEKSNLRFQGFDLFHGQPGGFCDIGNGNAKLQ